MLIIVGLGNPSPEYAETFHNTGFRAVDALAEALGKKIRKAECSALTSTFQRGGEKIVLAKPLTYMNLSGDAVKSLKDKYGATLSEIIIIYDDCDIDRFSVRARGNGSAGSHNGMKSIIERLGSAEFKRIRIGIGRGDGILKDYVLSKIGAEDLKEYDKVFASVSAALTQYIADKDFERLMRALNTKAEV